MGKRDAGYIGFLKGVAPDGSPWHLARDGHQRHRVHLGGGDAGHQVGRAGAAGGGADSHPSGGPCVPVGGHRSSLFVADKNVAQLRVVGHGPVQRQHRAARQPKDYFHPLLEEALADNLSAAKFHIPCQRMNDRGFGTSGMAENWAIKNTHPILKGRVWARGTTLLSRNPDVKPGRNNSATR